MPQSSSVASSSLPAASSRLNGFSLQGKVALVTGAASGFGAHFAQTLAAAGAKVICVARRQERVAAVAKAIQLAGGEALGMAADVTDRSVMESLLDAAQSEFGAIDILVNNAGASRPAPLQDMSDEQWDEVLNVGLRAIWQLSQQVSRRLIAARKPGSIINIASIVGFLAKEQFGNYGTAKAGIIQLTRTFALDLAPHGIRVNAIAPGYFNTEMTGPFFETEQGKKEVAALPTGRLGRYEELDGPLLLLASDMGSFMNGSVLTVDAGHSVRLS